MKIALRAILFFTCAMSLYSAENTKTKLFQGTEIFLDDDCRVVIVKGDKEEMEFFVTGKVFHGETAIGIRDINSKAVLEVTYTKKRQRWIALRIVEKPSPQIPETKVSSGT
jgi:hypothetical protein